MPRKLILPTVLLCSAIPTTLLAQDPQPSLGDVARQARKDKEKTAGSAKKIFTDDNLPTSKALSGLSDIAGSHPSDGGAAVAKGAAALDQVEATLNRLDPLDRSTLAKAALLSNDVEFPGRRAWEDKLYAAKQHYVAHGREIVGEARRLLADIQSLRTAQGGAPLNVNDPRSQEIVRRFREVLEDGVRTDSAYQTVVVEGWDLAKQAKH